MPNPQSDWGLSSPSLFEASCNGASKVNGPEKTLCPLRHRPPVFISLGKWEDLMVSEKTPNCHNMGKGTPSFEGLFVALEQQQLFHVAVC